MVSASRGPPARRRALLGPCGSPSPACRLSDRVPAGRWRRALPRNRRRDRRPASLPWVINGGSTAPIACPVNPDATNWGAAARRPARLNRERRETPTRSDRNEKSEQNCSPCSILYIRPPVTKINLIGGFRTDLGRIGVSRPRCPGVIPFPNPPRRGPNRATGQRAGRSTPPSTSLRQIGGTRSFGRCRRIDLCGGVEAYFC
jgi:hypothetical protein